MAAEVGLTVGIAGLTLAVVKDLVTIVNGIRNAPEVVRTTRADLVALESVLQDISTPAAGERSDPASAEEARQSWRSASLNLALKNCKADCKQFKKDLRATVTHSPYGEGWRDRINVGVLKRSTIESFHTRLQSSKATLSVALGVIQCLAASRPDTTSSEIKALVQDVLANVEKFKKQSEDRAVAAEEYLQEVLDAARRASTNHPSSLASIEAARQNLERLKLDVKVGTEAESAVCKAMVELNISDVTVGDQARGLVGVFGNKQAAPIKSTINKVNITGTSRGIVGHAETPGPDFWR